MISVHFQGKPFNITVIQVYALTSNAEEAERFYDLLELTPPQKCPFHYRESERKKESEVSWSCPTLCDPMDCSLSRSFVHGIFQARVLEWDAISFSRGSSQPRDGTWVSHIVGRRFTIWATVRSWSCFCWLYRTFPSLAAKNIISLISVLTI